MHRDPNATVNNNGTNEVEPASPQLCYNPFQFDSDTLAQLCAAVLQDRCAANRSLEKAHRSRYHSSRIPTIPLMDYLRRIAKYSRCSPESLIIAVIYLDRYVAATKIPLTFANVHRLTIVAVLVAAKIRDDIYYSNAYYGSIGGLHLTELNDLELEFIKILNWVSFVRPEEYRLYLDEIVKRYGTHLFETRESPRPQAQGESPGGETGGRASSTKEQEPRRVESPRTSGALAGASQSGSE